MKITPLDLKKPDFKRSMRGYDIDEVGAMLAAAAEEMEELIRENMEFKRKLAELETRNKTYENMENTLNETLIMAQKASEAARETARKEAELITARAEVEAEKMLEKARLRLVELKGEIAELESQKLTYIMRLRALVACQWKLLQDEALGDERKGAGAGGRTQADSLTRKKRGKPEIQEQPPEPEQAPEVEPEELQEESVEAEQEPSVGESPAGTGPESEDQVRFFSVDQAGEERSPGDEALEGEELPEEPEK